MAKRRVFFTDSDSDDEKQAKRDTAPPRKKKVKSIDDIASDPDVFDSEISERRSVQLSIVDSLKLLARKSEEKRSPNRNANTIEKYFSPKQKAPKTKEISVDDFFGSANTPPLKRKVLKQETPPCSPTTFIPDTPILSSGSSLNAVNTTNITSPVASSKNKPNPRSGTSFSQGKDTKKGNQSPVTISIEKTPSPSKIRIVPETPLSDNESTFDRTQVGLLSSPDVLSDMTSTTTTTINTKFEENETPKKSGPTKVERKSPTKLNKSLSSPQPLRPSEDRKSFWAYKARDGPRQLGSREIPKGKPNCLKNMTFLITGILETIEREDATSLIERCGGKVMKTLGKKTNYLVVGREPGQSKLAKADELKVKQLTEDELFDLINSHSPADQSQDSKSTTSPSKVNKKPTTSKSPSNSKISSSPLTARPVLLSNCTAPALIDGYKSNTTLEKPKESQLVGGTLTMKPNKTQELWVDKYRPTSFRSLIGLAGPASPANKLFTWLSTWHDNFTSGLKAKAYNSAPPWGNSNDDGRWARAVLLSGPPGIGKTSSANLVCNEVGFSVSEFNASDCRSKRYLSEELSLSLKTRNLVFGGASHGLQLNSKHHAIIMDEVDGMAGNEDRGGMQELINMIKMTHIPIICICNDRQSQKVRALANYCFDLRFHRPRVEQIKAALLSILCKENVTVPNNVLTDIIQASNQDIRQVINNVQMWCTSAPMNTDQLSQDAAGARKDLKLTPFDIVRKVFAPDISGPNGKLASFNDSLDLFFQDYSLVPLFVQENYLNVKPRDVQDSNKVLQILSQAADDIAMGDIVSKSIRASGTGSWSLLPVQGVFSVLRPGRFLRGSLPGGGPGGGVSFPSWFGKNSSQNRLGRVLTDLASHLRLSVHANSITSKGLILDYITPMAMALSRPLKEGDVGTVVQLLEQYNLSRDDFDSILELANWSSQPSRIGGVDSKVKAALTRTINKSTHLLPYTLSSGGIKSHRSSSTAAVKQGYDELAEGDAESAGLFDDDDDDADSGHNVETDFKNDAMIMIKKPSARSTAKNTNPEKPGTSSRSSTSSGRGSGRGRGRRTKTQIL